MTAAVAVVSAVAAAGGDSAAAATAESLRRACVPWTLRWDWASKT